MRYIIFVALLLASCNAIPQQQLTPVHCQAQNGMPDSRCTTGATFANVTVAQVCKPGYAASVRNVPQSEKQQVYAMYGISSHYPGEYEVDHEISLELGYERAAYHYKEAAKYDEAEQHEKAAYHAYLAHGHSQHAIHYDSEAAKLHAERCDRAAAAASSKKPRKRVLLERLVFVFTLCGQRMKSTLHSPVLA